LSIITSQMNRILWSILMGIVTAVCAVKADVPATNVAVKITSNRWTSDKALIATGTLTNTNTVPVTVTKIVANGFDENQDLVTVAYLLNSAEDSRIQGYFDGPENKPFGRFYTNCALEREWPRPLLTRRI
jgi:hypothetical protein